VIEEGDKPEWAVIPYEEHERLVEDLEMLRDMRAYDEAKKAIAEGEELIPSAITYAILYGENPIRVCREYRGLTQQELAEAAGISLPCLSQIETGKRKATTEVLAAVAKALGLSLDDVVATELA